MKFMKLGSKPDCFQTDGNNVRYVATELATDIIVTVKDVKFHLHKFPLLSKSTLLQKLVATTLNEDNGDEIDISEIPGGPTAFELCAKFCYSMTVTLNAYNVLSARCAAEFLGMHEMIEKGNLVYKIDIFLDTSIFRSWRDSIIFLQTTSVSQFCEELKKLIGNCIDSIASKASVDLAKVDWSYTYHRKKPTERICQVVPRDWWVEDLCELEVDLYKLVLTAIKNKGIISSAVIGEALRAYAQKKLPAFSSRRLIQCSNKEKNQSTVDTIVWLLPSDLGSVSCSFLLKLLKAAILVGSEERVKKELVNRIGQQLEEASVADLLITASEGQTMMYDVDVVQEIVGEYLMRNRTAEIELTDIDNDGIRGLRGQEILSSASKLMVAKLVDGYLAEISKDCNLPLSKFIDLAEMVSGFPRPNHDGLYQAIDMFLKEHPGISKSERKQICRLMDCKKLSVEASTDAVQNERLPLRVVVHVLFFEQARSSTATTSGCTTPDQPPKAITVNGGSHGSSRSTTTNTEEDLDASATAEELKALKALKNERINGEDTNKSGVDKAVVSKMKGLLISKKKTGFSKLWAGKGGRRCENSRSDSSDEIKSTPSRNRRNSVS